MAIIFNFCSLAASIFCLSAGFRFRHSYHQRRIEILKAYANAFPCLGLAYFFLALPGIILFDPFWIQIAFVLMDISFLLALLLSGPAFFGLSEKFRRFKKILFFLILFWILIYAFLNIVFFSEAIPLIENNVVYFWKSGVPWLQGIARGLAVAAVLAMVAFFFRWAIISTEKKIVYRSLIIGSGTLLIAAAGFILWFLPFFYFSSNLLIFSGALGLAGFMIGIIVKEIV